MADRVSYARLAAARSAAIRDARYRQLRADRTRNERARAMLSLAVTGSDDGTTRRTPFFYLRSGFIRNPKGGDPPPLAALVAHHEEALRGYLVLLLFQYLKELGRPAEIAGRDFAGLRPTLPGLLRHGDLSYDSHLQRWHRYLTTLERFNLIRLGPPGSRSRFRDVTLLNEDGSGQEWSLPIQTDARLTSEMSLDANESIARIGAHGNVIVLPTQFYTQGWLYVLNAREIGTLFSLWEARFRFGRRAAERTFIRRSDRLNHYHLTDESYLAHRELAEFSLLQLVDDEVRRVNGRLKPTPGQVILPLSFRVHRRNLVNPAQATVEAALRKNPAAPHLSLMMTKRASTHSRPSVSADSTVQTDLVRDPYEEDFLAVGEGRTGRVAAEAPVGEGRPELNPEIDPWDLKRPPDEPSEWERLPESIRSYDFDVPPPGPWETPPPPDPVS